MHVVASSTHENLSIDVLITSVRLMLTKLGRFQHFSRLKLQFQPFLKKKKNWIFNYNCRTDIVKAKVISFLGVQTQGSTDRQMEFWTPHMESWKHVSTQKKFPLKT